MEQADELSEIPVELQIARGLDQIQAHTSKIADMQRNISSALHTSSATGTTTWDEDLALVWERFEDPIQVHMSPEERVDVNDLIRTDNDLLNRVMVVFAYLCDEVQYLEQTAEETFYGPLLVFGEAAHDDESELKMGEEEEQIGRMLHFFQDLSNFVDRLNSVVLSIVQQMTSLYQARQRMYISTFKFVHMKPVFSALGDCIRVLMTLDMLVTENDCIVSAWLAYKKMMQVVRADPKRFEWDENKVKTYEKLLVSLDQTVMAGAMFQSCVEADFESPQEDDGDDGGRRIDIMDNRVFLKEFFTLLSEDLDENVAAIGHPAETNHRIRLMGTLGMYVLYRRLVPQNLRPDETFYKKLWEIQLTSPSISVCGKLSFFPADFLRQHVPPPMNLKKMNPSDPSHHRREYLSVIQSKFASRVSSLHKGLCQWCVRVHGTCRPVSQLRGAPLPNVLAEQSAIVVSGILLSYRVRNTLEEFMSLHLALDASINRTAIANIGRCIEVLKGLQLTFHSHETVFAQGVAHMVNQLKKATSRLLLPLKQRLSASKKMDDTKIDVLAAVTLIEDVFGGCQSMSFTRLCVTELALRVILMEGIVKQNISTELIRTIEQIKILSEWQTHLRKSCDLSGTLYWSREMLVPLLKALYKNGGEDAYRIPYIIQSFSDPLPLLQSILHENDPSADAIIRSYKKFVNESFTNTIITPLCRDIEKNLRLQIHAVHLHHMSSPNPKKEKNISDARKGFRLFKWIDEYGKIRKIVTAPSRTLSASYWKVVPITMRMCAFSYYLVDNFIWFNQITQGARYGRRDKNADKLIKRMKRYKNNFSLWRTIIALAWCTRLIGILIWYRPTTDDDQKENQDECQIVTTHPWIEYLTFHSVLLLRGIMNGFILCKHLGINHLSNMWVGRLGMLASILGMWKHWGVKKDYFVEFKKD